MSETYCGRSCTACTQGEALGCPGCEFGPGRRFSEECEIAKCCREKGHENCTTCSFGGTCAKLQSRDGQLAYRQKAAEARRWEREDRARRAALLGKWLWLLFWLVVPGNIAGVMKLDFVRQAAPTIYTAGRVLSGACTAAYGAILLKLRGEEDRYWTAGICTLAEAGVLLLVALLARNEKELGWQLVTLLAAIATIAGQYNEFGAHSAVLVGVDDGLAQKWTNLWKWFVGCTAAMVASILIVLFAPGLGLLVLLAGVVGIGVVSILKMVCLYRTAKVFRGYPAEGK